ncbi:MAG TPA: transcriptional repressor [Anaerolineae bacterium]
MSVDFANKLHSEGYRLTPQRQLILEAVRKAGGHLTPDQVYARVHTQHPAISRATIYRTLDFLCEMRLAVAMQWDGQTYYEIAGEQPHHHLICRTCGGIEELAPGLVDSFVEAVSHKQRFTIDMDHIALFGLCEPCRASEKKVAQHSAR